MIELVNKNYK